MINFVCDIQLTAHAEGCDSNPHIGVISGTVSNVSKVNYPDNYAIEEHDPKWMQATIHIDNIIKGNNNITSNAKEIAVLFPGSTDVAWYNSTKLGKGEQLILSIHKEHVPELNGQEAYTSVCRSDVKVK